MRGVSKQIAIKRVTLKIIKIATFQNKAFAFKRPKVRDRRLMTKTKLKGSQMQDRSQKDSIRNIASSADSISSKVPKSPMLIEHHPSHLNKSAVLSFHDSILLRNAWGEKLLINPMLKTKLIKRCISKLSPIVTVNDFQVVGMLIVQHQSQALKVLKHFILTLQEENPRVTRIIINDHQNI
jgi:hypothetical protein